MTNTASSSFPSHRRILPWLISRQRAVVLLTLFVLVTDLLFIALHTEAALRGSPNALLFIDFDRGYAEVFQYVKFLYILFLITILSVECRSWVFTAWLPPYAYLLADDAFQIHERYGARLVELLSLQPRFGLRAQDFGELITSTIAAGISLILLITAYIFADKEERWTFRRLTELTILLGIFGVIIDLIHVAVHSLLGEFDWVAVVEDGGEMLVVTLLVAFLFRLNVSGGTPDFPTRPKPRAHRPAQTEDQSCSSAPFER